MEASETTRLLGGESRESRDEEAATQTPKEQPLEWESPSDPGNPKNWSRSRKWTCTMIVSFYCLMAPTAAAMVIPAMPSLARDLNITSDAFLQLTMSLFVFGWTGGPLVLGPLSEVFGRAPILHIGNFGFITFNLLCGFVRNQHAFVFLRFISGLCGSGPTSLGTGILSDLWTSDERGTSLAIYTIMPLVGPTAGPLLAGYVVQYYNWPYIFFLCSLLAAIVLVPGVVILPETFGPVILLRRRAERLRQKGISLPIPAAKHGKHDTTKKRIRKGLARPFILLGTQPIIQVLALYFGFYFGLYQLFIAMYHAMWRDMYDMTPIQASANYLSITIGLILGCEIAGPLNDKIYRYLRQRNNGIDLPEYRIWLMLPAAILVPGGLLWFGWSAVAQAHWIIPNLGMATACVGIVMTFMCMQAYVMDAYPVYAASAQGALTVVRSLTAFTMPVMAPAMVHQWGYGWSSTVLAIIAVVVGSLAPAFLHLKGASLRAKSPYAAGNVNLER
ncbi:putative Major facilitator superfamily (MFS) profile domain-containing protein [Seiridium unicorne]|uniref:Major facilitator superfamily (MFS) profile domain-containing protein n=1 Tax=Seiridium unicorne TaxID=138068 RepID=A0ABR2V5J1_9PEZI